MEDITRKDLNIFENEILKDIKLMEEKLNEKITKISTSSQNSILLMEQKYENTKVKIEEIMNILESQNVIDKVNKRLDKFNSKLEEKIALYNTKISTFEKDLSNACFKYDKIFLNNISSPGLIGDGCPYPSMKVFLKFVNDKINDMISSKEKFGVDFKSHENWIKLTLDNFKKEQINAENNHLEFIEKEIAKYDKRSFEKMNMVEDKLNSIRIENGSYNLNFKKKSEELEEKIKIFENMNNNIINICNDYTSEYMHIKNVFNDLSKYFKIKKLTSTSKNNRALYDEMSKKVSISMKRKQQKRYTSNLNNNIIPSISSMNIPSIPKKSENSVQKFNIEIKESGTKLAKKKSLKIENISMSGFVNTTKEKNVTEKFDLKQAFKSSNQILSNVGNFSILGSFDKERNEDFVLDNKASKKISLSRNNIKAFNDFISEDNRESDSQILNNGISINDNTKKDNEKENDSSFYYDGEDDDEDEREDKDGDKDQDKILDKDSIKDKDKDKERDKNIDRDKDLNEINNKNNDDNKLLKNQEITSNSISNLETIERKIIATQKGNEYNNNKLAKENIVTKINLDEELKKINQKFDKLNKEANEKIMEITNTINDLVYKINKAVFSNENINKIKGVDFSDEKRKKIILLSNSGISLPKATSYAHNYNSSKKDKDKENKISFKNKNIYNSYSNGKLNYNIININRTKISNLRTTPNDILHLIKNKTDVKQKYIKMLNLNSVNNIEAYLIKKFTEDS